MKRFRRDGDGDRGRDMYNSTRIYVQDMKGDVGV